MESPHDNGNMHWDHEPYNLPVPSSHTLSSTLSRSSWGTDKVRDKVRD